MTLIQDTYYKDIVRIDLEKVKNEETGVFTWQGKVFVNGYFDADGQELIAQKEIFVSNLVDTKIETIFMALS